MERGSRDARKGPTSAHNTVMSVSYRNRPAHRKSPVSDDGRNKLYSAAPPSARNTRTPLGCIASPAPIARPARANRDVEIVGVAKDARYGALQGEFRDIAYVPFLRWKSHNPSVRHTAPVRAGRGEAYSPRKRAPVWRSRSVEGRRQARRSSTGSAQAFPFGTLPPGSHGSVAREARGWRPSRC